MDDCLIIGAGVIGLSLAYELSGRGLRVRVLDRQQPASEASWAGAGILPPANECHPQSPLEQLAALSLRLHSEWAERLREETGIDNEFRRCGAWYLTVRQDDGGSSPPAKLSRLAASELVGDSTQSVPLSNVEELEPALQTACRDGTVVAAAFAKNEAQVRNPRHLRALLAACERRGVTIEENVEVSGFWSSAGHVVGAQTSVGPKYAGTFCIASGAWTGRLLEAIGLRIPIRPIRGQIVLLDNPQPSLRRIVNVRERYFVPRMDGRVLVGSTEEDVGFDKRNTEEGVAGLLDFARSLIPPWLEARVERTWAGLRPATADGLPYIGRVPSLANAFVAAGHFRSGIYLSPATATVMSELIRGERPSIDLAAFRMDREAGDAGERTC